VQKYKISKDLRGKNLESISSRIFSNFDSAFSSKKIF